MQNNIKKSAAAFGAIAAVVGTVYLSTTATHAPKSFDGNATFVVFRPHRSSAVVGEKDGATFIVTKPEDFKALTNAVWSDIDQSKWSQQWRLYRIDFSQ